MKINQATCKVMSGDISIDTSKIRSWYIYRDTFINVNTDISSFVNMHLSTSIDIHIAITFNIN